MISGLRPALAWTWSCTRPAPRRRSPWLSPTSRRSGQWLTCSTARSQCQRLPKTSSWLTWMKASSSCSKSSWIMTVLFSELTSSRCRAMRVPFIMPRLSGNRSCNRKLLTGPHLGYPRNARSFRTMPAKLAPFKSWPMTTCRR